MNLNDMLIDLDKNFSNYNFRVYVNEILLMYGKPIEIMKNLSFEFKLTCEDVYVRNYIDICIIL